MNPARETQLWGQPGGPRHLPEVWLTVPKICLPALSVTSQPGTASPWQGGLGCFHWALAGAAASQPFPNFHICVLRVPLGPAILVTAVAVGATLSHFGGPAVVVFLVFHKMGYSTCSSRQGEAGDGRTVPVAFRESILQVCHGGSMALPGRTVLFETPFPLIASLRYFGG